MATARQLPLTLLDRPLSADQRAECRTIVRAVIVGPADRRTAEAEFLHAAAVLARMGTSEADLRDLLDEDDGCRQRSHLRNGRGG